MKKTQEFQNSWSYIQKIDWAIYQEDRYANALVFAMQSRDINLIESVKSKLKIICGSDYDNYLDIANRLFVAENKQQSFL